MMNWMNLIFDNHQSFYSNWNNEWIRPFDMLPKFDLEDLWIYSGVSMTSTSWWMHRESDHKRTVSLENNNIHLIQLNFSSSAYVKKNDRTRSDPWKRTRSTFFISCSTEVSPHRTIRMASTRYSICQSSLFSFTKRIDLEFFRLDMWWTKAKRITHRPIRGILPPQLSYWIERTYSCWQTSFVSTYHTYASVTNITSLAMEWLSVDIK